jgi:hypothetical protein
MRLDAAVGQTPPPPYTAVVSSDPLNTAVPEASLTATPPAPRKPIRPNKCPFCGSRFTRKREMWDCVARHLERRTTEAVPCPYPECKLEGIVLENDMRLKNHAWVVHGEALRPRIIIRTRAAQIPPDSPKLTTPRIILTRGADKHEPYPRVILQVGRRKRGGS